MAISWFTTRTGRIFTRTTVGLISVSIFAVPAAFHGPFLNVQQSIFQIYKNKKPRPVNRKVLALANEVLKECDISEQEKDKVSFFVPSGLDIRHGGGINSPWGAIVGLPLSFGADFTECLPDFKIIGEEDFDWLTDGLDLIDTLRFSEEAKRFAVAREIYAADINQPFESATFRFGCFFFPAMFCKHFNKMTDSFNKFSVAKRYGVYTVFYLFGILFYSLLRDPLNYLRDIKADIRAAKMGPKYLQGGIDYYTKILEKNKELRLIFDDRGKSHYTEDGNANYFFLAPKVPITMRLEKLQEMQKKQTAV